MLENTTYTGIVNISENENGTTSENPITVNIDETSVWVLTDNTTVSNLNIENASSILDEESKTVSIINGDKTIVKGDSSLILTVTNTYGTEITTTGANELSNDYIDRTAFDAYFNTSTIFSDNTSSENTTETAASEAVEEVKTSSENSNGLMIYAVLGLVIVLGGYFFIKNRKK